MCNAWSLHSHHLKLGPLHQWLKWPGPSAWHCLSKGTHWVFPSLSCKRTGITVETLPPSTSTFSKSREKCLWSFGSLVLLPSYFPNVFVCLGFLSWYFHMHLFFSFSCIVDFSMPGRKSIFSFSISLPTLLLLESRVHTGILLVNASFPRK